MTDDRRSTARLLAGGSLLAILVLAVPTSAGAQTTADDPMLGDQWALAHIGATAAWATARGEGITVAVVDTGADLEHEDLAGRIVAHTACLGTLGDPARCDGSADDDDGHGTHVAGIVAAEAGNGRGVAGVAPAAGLMIVKALRHVCTPLGDGAQDCRGVGATDDVRAAIRWAVDRGAHVVNVSWADDVATRLSGGSPLADAVQYAWDRGAVVVVASGNDHDAARGSGYGNLPLVVVTAVTPDGGKAPYANGVGAGVRWGIAAPGGDGSQGCPARDVVSTYTGPGDDDGYGCLAGTSMAAPHVAGAIAILRSIGLGPLEAVDRMLATADDAGAPGVDASFGAGVLDVAGAVEGLTHRPAAGVPAPSGGAVASGSGARAGAQAGSPGPAVSPPPTPSPAATPPPAPAPGPAGPPPAPPAVLPGDSRHEVPPALVAFATALVALDLALLAAARRRRRTAGGSAS